FPVSWGGRARQSVLLARQGRELLQQGQGRQKAPVWARLSAWPDWRQFPPRRCMYVDPDGRQSFRPPDDRSTSGPVWYSRLDLVRDGQRLVQRRQSQVPARAGRAEGMLPAATWA